MNRLKILYTKLLETDWHDCYCRLYSEVEQIRERIKSGEGLSPKDKPFLERLIFLQDNRIADIGMSMLSRKDFDSLIGSSEFLSALEQLILTPNHENFRKFGDVWAAIATRRNSVRINRVAAACTLQVSGTADKERFDKVFQRLIDKGMIPKYSREDDWFSKNIFLMEHIHSEFHDELKRGETDKFYLSMFVWLMYLDLDKNWDDS